MALRTPVADPLRRLTVWFDGECPICTAEIWFDGECPICTAEIQLIRRLDRAAAIEFVDLTIPGACPSDKAARLSRLHAQPSGGPMVSGAAAFVAMWRVLPNTRLLAAAASNPPALWLLERAYRLFLRMRPGLQAIVRRRLTARGGGAG